MFTESASRASGRGGGRGYTTGMIRPARSHRRSARGGLPLAAVLVALMAVGPAPAVVLTGPTVNEEEVGHQYVETRRCVRPLVGPPVPPRSTPSPDRPVLPAGSQLLPRHLRPSAPARGPDGPYLRC